MASPISHLFDKPLVANVLVNMLSGSSSDSTDIVDLGNYIKIKYFPYKWFSSMIKKMYGTIKITHMYELGGIRLFGRTAVKLHKFFIPEMIYVLSQSRSGRAHEIASDLMRHTWVRDLYDEEASINSDTDMSRIYNEMNVKLFDWQEEFIKIFDIKRRRAHLHGELLSFGCGLGKTITALATMTSVGCDGVVIIAPKSTLVDVWVDHIRRFYKKFKKIYLVNKDTPQDADFFIFNYESMDKLDGVMKYLKGKKKLGIVVDESHNFLDLKSNRSQNLVKLRQDTQCDRVLMMSGTPLKALGCEVLSLLRVIDSYLDDESIEIFKKAFGLNTTMGSDILHSRLNIVMHRKTMEEVYKLPEMIKEVLPIKIKSGGDYTISSVKKQLKEYIEQRTEYHKKREKLYKQEWETSIAFLYSVKAIASSKEFERYLTGVKYLQKKGYSQFDKWIVQEVVWMNKYEKDVLIPAMPKKIKDQFLDCKSKIKYLSMCIQGETLGYLDTLRSKMVVDMLKEVDVSEIVVNSLKKVIFATTYVAAVDYLRIKCEDPGFKPICVYGKTSKDAPALLQKFRENKEHRVLIATMQTLSTGVTLTEANTVVFVNEPWRSADAEQMAHRIFRIGQDTECHEMHLKLDTGSSSNLSDRTQEILDWSREMTDAIVDGK